MISTIHPCRYRLLLLAMLSTSLAAHADETRSLQEIVVTASRIELPVTSQPFAVERIDAERIQAARPLLGLDESLRVVPGLLMQNRFNYAQDLRISMRGFGARSAFGIRGIRIVVDGIPETLPDGQGGVDGIDLGAAGSIEVLKGGASAIYGNAGGGVILVTTAPGPEADEVTLSLASGSDGYRRWQAGVAGDNGPVNYRLAVSELALDGYREHSEARNRQASGRLALSAVAGGDWLFSAHYTDQPQAEDPGGVNREQFETAPRAARDANVAFDAGESLRQLRLGARFERTLASAARLSVRQYWTERDFLGRLPFASGGVIDLERRFVGGGVAWQQPLRLGTGEHLLVAGIDVDRQDDERQRFDNMAGIAGAVTLAQRERVDSIGAYVQSQWRLGSRWQATVGARFDRLDFDVTDRFLVDGDDSGARRFSEWSPVLGVLWQASPQWQGYANLSRSFESPTTTELANPSTTGGFNPELAAATALHRELGVRYDGARDRWSAALFDIRLRDELISFELAAFPGRDFFENAGSSERRGVELSWQRRWRPGLDSRISYTWSDFVFDTFVSDGVSFAGNTIPGTAEHVAFATLDYTAAAGWFAALEVSYQSDITLNNANSATSDAFTLLGIRAGYEWQREALVLEPFVSISNATATEYAANTRINAFGGRYFEAGPDRSVHVGLRGRFRMR